MSTQLDTREDTVSDTSVATRESADSLTGLSTIEGIDLDLEPPCEHSQHGDRHYADGPAWGRVLAAVPCGHVRRAYLICAEGWQRMGVHGTHCGVCLMQYRRDEAMSLLHVL